MYEAFYGLNEKPFSVPPDSAYLYLSAKHKNALSRLQYSIINHAAFTVVTGEIGSGKTTLIRELIHQLDENDEFTVGLVSNVNFSSFAELMQWILYAFELEYDGKNKVSLFEAFTDYVIQNYGEGRRTVLIIDEAQNLSPDVLEQLRMLSNINAGQHQVLQLILVGQSNLLDTLKRPELEQFAQRIEVDFYLKPLDLDETAKYIQHRIKVAGGDGDLFSTDTYPLIWRSTSGVPRLINVLCGMALVYAFADFKDRVDIDVINLVLKDKEGGFSPLDANNTALEMNPRLRGVASNSLYSVSAGDKHDENVDSQSAKELSTIEKLFLNNKE